jgi:hypothetical protein
MRLLEKILKAEIKKRLRPEEIGIEIIGRHLKGSGICLTKAQEANLKERLRRSGWEELTLTLEDHQVPPDFYRKEDGQDGPITFHVNDANHILDDVVSQFEAQLEKVIPQIVCKAARTLHRGLRRHARENLSLRRKDRDAFRSRLARRWRKPLDLLEMIIAIAAEAGADFNQEWRPAAVRRQAYAFEALARLHARACQIASEVLALLEGGYADGAHARWRSLHEVAVVGLFISQRGDDVAERYLLHDAVESYKAATQYQRYAPSLGYEQLTEEELRVVRRKRDAVITRFGETYGEDYGWAAAAMNLKRVSIADIERAAGLDYLRPFYRMASHNIHANAKGVFAKLGLCANGPDHLLAGPSNFGLADPGHGAAISLLQITVAFLTHRASVDNLVIGQVLSMLVDECGKAFLEVQIAIEKEASIQGRRGSQLRSTNHQRHRKCKPRGNKG